MLTIRGLILVMTVVGCIFGFIALTGRWKKSSGQAELEHKKCITNEYFVKSLVENKELIGNSISSFQDIPQAADYTFEKGSPGEIQLTDKLTLMTPASLDCQLFAEMFSDSGNYVKPKLEKGDTVHWFLARSSKMQTLEGTVTRGYLVFCRNDIVVAITKVTSNIPN